MDAFEERLLEAAAGPILLLLNELRHQLNEIKEITVANQARIDALADQVDKVHGEVVSAIDELKAQVAAGEQLDFSRLDSTVQRLDDVVPDAQPGEEPGTEEPGTEEPGTEEPGTEEPGTEEPGPF